MFRQLSNHLKKHFGDYRVTVRRCQTPKCQWGDCSKRSDGSFVIRISNEIDEAAQQVVLLHEWSHILSWETDKHPSEHGSRFGLAYARVWQCYLKWIAN